MALRAGYYGIKRFLCDKLQLIAGTYDKTIKSLFPRSEQAVLGAKNLLRYSPGVGTITVGDVTFTFNADDSVTVNGTASQNIYLQLFKTDDNNLLPEGNYILNGGVAGGSSNTYALYLQERNSANTDWVNPAYFDYDGNGCVYSRTNNNHYAVIIFIKNGYTISNKTFYPMIRLASDPDDTYAPHAMTNKELTDSAAEQKTSINAIITAATGAADFTAFKTAMGAITPVTRSLSLTKEDITEEVKEDVEPEKTVIKKRTTKKTEEV